MITIRKRKSCKVRANPDGRYPLTKSDNVALLKRFIAKQDDILNMTEDMEEIETFFSSRRKDIRLRMRIAEKLVDERDYFAD